MSSSNVAVNLDNTAPDLLSHPPRPQLRVITDDESPEASSIRRKTLMLNRLIVTRDQGFRYFRFR